MTTDQIAAEAWNKIKQLRGIDDEPETGQSIVKSAIEKATEQAFNDGYSGGFEAAKGVGRFLKDESQSDDTKRLDWILSNWKRRSRLVSIKNREDIDKVMMGKDKDVGLNLPRSTAE